MSARRPGCPTPSEDLSPYDIRQYIEDYVSGNVGLKQWLIGICYIVYQNLIKLGIGLGKPLRWLYDHTQSHSTRPSVSALDRDDSGWATHTLGKARFARRRLGESQEL